MVIGLTCETLPSDNLPRLILSCPVLFSPSRTRSFFSTIMIASPLSALLIPSRRRSLPSIRTVSPAATSWRIIPVSASIFSSSIFNAENSPVA